MLLYIALNSGYVNLSVSGAGQAGAMSAGSAVFWMACALLVALAAICGLVAGFLSWRGGANTSNAVLYGFGACGVAAGLGIAFFALLV
ncbi:hypothetical protein ACWDSJ_27935 [Nocardia sp. NPDC003482]